MIVHYVFPTLSNIVRRRVNEVLFGATSFDTLFALSSDEVSQCVGNRIDRLAAHILQQQSFMPSFPLPGNLSAPVIRLAIGLIMLTLAMYVGGLQQSSTLEDEGLS